MSDKIHETHSAPFCQKTKGYPTPWSERSSQATFFAQLRQTRSIISSGCCAHYQQVLCPPQFELLELLHVDHLPPLVHLQARHWISNACEVFSPGTLSFPVERLLCQEMDVMCLQRYDARSPRTEQRRTLPHLLRGPLSAHLGNFLLFGCLKAVLGGLQP